MSNNTREMAKEINKWSPSKESQILELVLGVLLDIKEQNEELLNFVRED